MVLGSPSTDISERVNHGPKPISQNKYFKLLSQISATVMEKIKANIGVKHKKSQ